MERGRRASKGSASRMDSGCRAGGIAAVAAAAALLSLPSGGFAATTIGSDLTRDPDTWIGNTVNTFSLGNVIVPGRGAASPVGGVISRWRMRTDGASPGRFSLGVARPNLATSTATGVATGPPETPPAGPTLHTFAARLPIAAGDGILVHGYPGPAPSPQPGQPFGAYLAGHTGALLVEFVPALRDGETRTPNSTESDLELLVNADVEPDADRDLHGDETQDPCPDDAVPAGGPCTPPGARLGGRRVQRVVRQRAVVVRISGLTEASSTRARGTISAPGESRVFRLRPVTRQIPQGGRATLRLRLGRRALRAVRRALAKRKRVRARVSIRLTDAGGYSRTLRRTIRARR